MILDDLLAADRRLRLAVKAVRAAPDHVPALAALVADYLEAYCRHYGFDAARVGAVCNDFTERYLADLAAFRKTGKYPRAEAGSARSVPGRSWTCTCSRPIARRWI